MPIKLYAHPLSSYSQKAKMALYENDIAFEEVLTANAEPVSDAFLALWPIGKFPILVDDGKLVFDATTIIEYLEAAHPGHARLLPRDPIAAVEVRMLDRFFDNYVQTPMQNIVGAAMGHTQVDDSAWRSKLDIAYAWLDHWLVGRQWASSDNFSLADCAAAPALFYAQCTHSISENFSNLLAYRRRLMSRPSYARVLQDASPYRHLFPLGIPDEERKPSD